MSSVISGSLWKPNLSCVPLGGHKKKKCDICTIEVRKSQRTSNEVVVGVGVSQRLSGNIHFSKSGLEYSAGLWGKFVSNSTVDFDFYLKKKQKNNTITEAATVRWSACPVTTAKLTMVSVQASQALLFSEGIPSNVNLILIFLPF